MPEMSGEDYVTSELIGGSGPRCLYPIKIKDAQIKWRKNPGVKIEIRIASSLCFHTSCVILTELSYQPWLPEEAPVVPGVHATSVGWSSAVNNTDRRLRKRFFFFFFKHYLFLAQLCAHLYAFQKSVLFPPLALVSPLLRQLFFQVSCVFFQICFYASTNT